MNLEFGFIGVGGNDRFDGIFGGRPERDAHGIDGGGGINAASLSPKSLERFLGSTLGAPTGFSEVGRVGVKVLLLSGGRRKIVRLSQAPEMVCARAAEEIVGTPATA